MRSSSVSPGAGLLADGGGIFPGENAWKSRFGPNVGDISLIMICRAIAVTSSVKCCPQWEVQRLVVNFYILVPTVGINFRPQAVACTLASVRFPE